MSKFNEDRCDLHITLSEHRDLHPNGASLTVVSRDRNPDATPEEMRYTLGNARHFVYPDELEEATDQAAKSIRLLLRIRFGIDPMPEVSDE